MDQQINGDIQLVEVSYDNADIQRMIGRLNRYQINLYGIEMCNLDSIEVLRVSGAYLIGAYYRNILVGMGAAKLFEEYAEIKRMFVDPDFRGQNIARDIMTILEAYSKRMGVKVVNLETGNLQSAAITFYKKCGYQIVEKFGNYTPNPVSVYFEKYI